MALLFIGSTVADVVIRLPQLPYTGDDVHITSQQVSLGGCAYNACHTARLTGITDCTLFSPVGTGVWGDWVRRVLADRQVLTAVPPVDAPNGCCYCLVEPNGERTFMCEHGAEYAFRPEWFDTLTGDYGGVYVCGLEIEEPTGEVILDWLEQHPPRRLYFAPGPRLMHIPPRKMARLMELHAVFHMNEAEICHFTRSQDVSQAAHMLQTLTQNDVIVTLGDRGAYVLHDEEEAVIPGVPARVVDTIGAGDAHIGAVMAFEAAGQPLAEAIRQANIISAAVVSQSGAELSKEKYEAIEARRFY